MYSVLCQFICLSSCLDGCQERKSSIHPFHFFLRCPKISSIPNLGIQKVLHRIVLFVAPACPNIVIRRWFPTIQIEIQLAIFRQPLQKEFFAMIKKYQLIPIMNMVHKIQHITTDQF